MQHVSDSVLWQNEMLPVCVTLIKIKSILNCSHSHNFRLSCPLTLHS